MNEDNEEEIEILKKYRSADNPFYGVAFWLTFIFAVLKLAGQVSWSWLWVFSPVWLSALLSLVIILFLAVWSAFGGD
jgi:hypothetical protein